MGFMKQENKKVVVILGPTSSGKTKWAVKLAHRFNGEIISADSRQVYRGMDVGTGKDLAEYKLIVGGKCQMSNVKCQMTNIPYHLIDVVGPGQDFNLAKYQKLAVKAIKDVLKRGKLPIVVGGTGLYIQALVDNYDLPGGKPDLKLRKKLQKKSLAELLQELKKKDLASYRKVDKKNKRRVERALEYYLTTGQSFLKKQAKQKPEFEFLLLGIKVDKDILDKRIKSRLKHRLEKEGLANEVRKLHKQGLSWKKLDNFGLEYRWVSRYLRGQVDYDTMFEELNRAIKQFSKRQRTWFKRDERIVWCVDYREIIFHVKNFIIN